MKTVCIVGGDKRNFYMAICLKQAGIKVYAYDVPGLNDGNPYDIESIDSLRHICSLYRLEEEKPVLVLPIPVTKDNINIFCNQKTLAVEELLSYINCFSLVCGGVIPKDIQTVCTVSELPVYDFMEDDTVACKNAVATAEGAILEAFSLSSINIEKSKSLVTGFGRCARVLAEKLQVLQSEVTVLARSISACEEAEKLGYHSILLDRVASADPEIFLNFDFCYNTVPALILNQQILSKFSPDVVVIDIASKPGGTDFAYCEKNSIVYKHSLGIPGRYSPKTSGEILAEAVCLKGF